MSTIEMNPIPGLATPVNREYSSVDGGRCFGEAISRLSIWKEMKGLYTGEKKPGIVKAYSKDWKRAVFIEFSKAEKLNNSNPGMFQIESNDEREKISGKLGQSAGADRLKSRLEEIFGEQISKDGASVEAWDFDEDRYIFVKFPENMYRSLFSMANVGVNENITGLAFKYTPNSEKLLAGEVYPMLSPVAVDYFEDKGQITRNGVTDRVAYFI